MGKAQAQSRFRAGACANHQPCLPPTFHFTLTELVNLVPYFRSWERQRCGVPCWFSGQRKTERVCCKHQTQLLPFENKVSTLCLAAKIRKGLCTCLSFSLKEQLQAADSLAFLCSRSSIRS